MSRESQTCVLAGSLTDQGAVVDLLPSLTVATLTGPDGSFVLMSTSAMGPRVESWITNTDGSQIQVGWCQLSDKVLSIKLFGRSGLSVREDGDRLSWQLELCDGDKRRVVRAGTIDGEVVRAT